MTVLGSARYVAVAAVVIACAGCASSPAREGQPAAIVQASVGAASWVARSDGTAAVSADAGRSWQALRSPRPPAPGPSVAVTGQAVTVVALSGQTLTVQRSADGGDTWQQRTSRLSQPADTAAVATSADGRTLAVAASAPGSAGAGGGYTQLLVGPSGGRLVGRPAPGGPDVAWSGSQLLMPGGALRTRLYASGDLGRTWTPRPVGGAVAPDHDVAPDAPVFGTPIPNGAATVVPVTRPGGTVTLYRTSGGATFTRMATFSLGGDIGPGVGAVASSYGPDGVVVADPVSTALHTFVDGTQRTLAGTGLPGPVDALSFQSRSDGLAQVTVRGCAHGKADCSEELRVYRTGDGGATWTRSTP